jgi:hypothetical protein
VGQKIRYGNLKIATIIHGVKNISSENKWVIDRTEAANTVSYRAKTVGCRARDPHLTAWAIDHSDQVSRSNDST